MGIFWSSYDEEAISKDDVDRLMRADKKAIEALNLLKNRIRSAHTDYSISKTVGSGVSIGGAVASVAGVLLVPFTAGWSLTLTIGGITAGILGGRTTMTTGIIEIAKSQQWKNELMAAFADEEKELKRIAEKIVKFPEWQDWTMKGASSTVSLVLKGKTAYTMATVGRYLSITNIKYGDAVKDLATIKDILDPGFWNSIKYGASATHVREITIPGGFLAQEGNMLNSFLSKIGLPTVQVGATALKSIAVGVGVLGIGLDIYTIVDTWVNDPALVGQIDELISKLEKSSRELGDFKNDLLY